MNPPSAAAMVDLADYGPNGSPLIIEKVSGIRDCALLSEAQLVYLRSRIDAVLLKLHPEVPVDG